MSQYINGSWFPIIWDEDGRGYYVCPMEIEFMGDLDNCRGEKTIADLEAAIKGDDLIHDEADV